MHVRRFVGSALLTGLALTAQQGQQGQQPQPPSPAPAPAAGAAAPAVQDPDKKQDPDKPKPEDRIAELQKEKERLQKEIEFVRERAANLGSDLKEKLGKRDLKVRAIDAGTNAAGPVAAPMKKARKFSEDELKDMPPDVLLLVAGSPIRERELTELTTYLESFPASGDATLRQQRAMFELIRTRATTAALAAHTPAAEKAIREAREQVTTHAKPFAEVAKAVSKGPGAEEGGKVEVHRNSHLGLKVEQSAFSTKEGETSEPFHTPLGVCILRVEKLVKGDTPDGDKVEIGLIQIPWTADQNELQRVQSSVATGQIEIVVRDDRAMAMVPPLFRPMEPPVEIGLDTQIQGAKERIRMLDDEIAQRKSVTDDAGKAQLAELEKMRQRLADELKRLEAMKEQQIHGDKVEDAGKSGDGQKPLDAPKKEGAVAK